MKKRKRYVIGIDAGVHTGLAVYDRIEKRIIHFHTSNFWDAYDWILNNYPSSDTQIVIENPDSSNAIYRRLDWVKGENVRESMARRIGSNRREATLLIERFTCLVYDVTPVKPTSGKWNAAQLKSYTGISERTNEHVRDAIKLVFGM